MLAYQTDKKLIKSEPLKAVPFRKNCIAGALAGILGCVITPQLHALSIGEIALTSALNAPLEGVLTISLDAGEVIHQNELSIKLASRDAHHSAGLPYPVMLKKLEIEEEQQSGRNIQFQLHSPEPVYEPIISLLLQLEWDQGSLQKEITFLLDPVGYTPVRSISPENENLVKPGDYIGSRPEPASSPNAPRLPIFVSDNNEPARPEEYVEKPRAQRRAITFNNGEYGPVIAGDTLSRISVAAGRQVGINTSDMMELIYDSNPEAFINSPNNLIKGAILQIPGLLPELRDVQTIPSEDAEIINPHPVIEAKQINKPLLTIVGSEEEASRVLPSEDKAPTGDLNLAGDGESNSNKAPSEGNEPMAHALQRIQDLELANQTLTNDKFALENNLSNTQEQLGSVRNELDRLVVELKVLSQIQAESQQKDPAFASQIERWLPWLLLFFTLPAALFFGLRSRPQERAVYAPVEPQAATPEEPVTEIALDPLEGQVDIDLDSTIHERANPADSQVFSFDEEPMGYTQEVQIPDLTLDAELDEELSADHPEHTQSLLDDESEPEFEHSSAVSDPLAETIPGLVISKDNQEELAQQAPEAFDAEEEDIPAEPSADVPERTLQSLPADGDTQEVIRSTLNRLEATQLISPGQSPMEPEQSLDATQEAEIYIAYDQFSLAEKTIERLLKQQPDNDKYLLLQLKLFAETGNMDALQNLSVKLLHKHPEPDNEINQRIKAICDKAFTETNLKRADLAKSGDYFIEAENQDNETILEDMTAETLFVDGVEDYIDNATLSEEDELRTGMSLNSTLDGYTDDFDEALNDLTEDSLGSLTTQLPPHLLEDRDRTEIFDDRSISNTQVLIEGDEETLSEGLELPFDLESEIAKYESELEHELGKKK